MVDDFADRADDGRRAAEAALGERADFFKLDGALFDRHAEVLRDVDERTARDGRKDGAGLRRDELAVLRDEQEVRAARLFDVRARRGIEEHVLVKAVLMREDVRIEAHGVIQAGLDVACAVRGCTVVVADADRDRLHAVLEVRADRRAEQAELVLVCRLDADDGARREEVRTKVERTARLERRNPVLIGADDFVDGFHEHLFRYRRHLDALCRIHHALRVHIRTERDDAAVFRLVRLEALEDLLAVLEDAGALIEDDVRIIREAAFFPFAILVVRDIALRDRLIAEPEAVPIDVDFRHISAPFLSLE